jgi:hypothetical protein
MENINSVLDKLKNYKLPAKQKKPDVVIEPIKTAEEIYKEDIEFNYKKSLGGIRLYRSLLKSNVWASKDDGLLRVFLYCLLRANWQEKDVIIGNQKIHLKAGEFITSYQKIALDCNLTLKKSMFRVKALKRSNNLAIKTSNKFSIISVKNWQKWQGEGKQNGKQKENQRENKRHRLIIYNNNNNIKKEFFEFLGTGQQEKFLRLSEEEKMKFFSVSKVERILSFYQVLKMGEVGGGKFQELKTEFEHVIEKLLSYEIKDIYKIMANLDKNNRLSLDATLTAIKHRTALNANNNGAISDVLASNLQI